jgi:anhydro-N-acetylmuramic acid kinase
MKANVQHLMRIAEKPVRTIVGLMSGTSIDGLDIALCVFHGTGTASAPRLLRFISVPYTPEQVAYMRPFAVEERVRVEDLAIANAWIARLHASLVMEALAGWGVKPAEVDLLASHGQTVRHAPRRIHGRSELPDATLQIGDGDHLAALTGILTVSDFRQKHVALGGEGAPLAGYGDDLLYRSATEPRILLNIGGIGNLTWLPVERTDAILTFDTGPGNTLIDAFTRRTFGMRWDADGAIAATGRVHETWLATLMADPYFAAHPPKTTGPEYFHLDKVMAACPVGLSDADILATLTSFTSASITHAVRTFTNASALAVLYASGGGVHNRTLMADLSRRLTPMRVDRFETLGLDPDAKEALLFAALANELVCGEVLTLGKVSFP